MADDDDQPAYVIVSESGTGITKQTNIRITPGQLPQPVDEYLSALVQQQLKDPRKEALRRARDTLRSHNLPVFNPMVLCDPICYDSHNIRQCRPLHAVARVDVGQRIIRHYGNGLLAWTLPRGSCWVLTPLSDYVTDVPWANPVNYL